MLCSALIMLHIIHGMRNTVNTMDFQCIFFYMKLEDEIGTRTQNNSQRTFIPQKVSNLIPQFHQRHQKI